MKKAVVIIPARYQSSRYPGKPLVNLLGKPMVIWVAELSAKAIGIENTYIATDDEKIAKTVSDYGFQYIMTNSSALTGTDRLAQASEKIDADIYINVQGDEPLANPNDILRVRDEKIKNMDAIINCYTTISENEVPENVNIPKVIVNENDDLVYMSRLAIPGFKDIKNKPQYYLKQICLYAFTKEELNLFTNFGRKGYLESCEDIEILRFLDLNKKIKMIAVTAGSLAVDCPEDVAAVEKKLKEFHNL